MGHQPLQGHNVAILVANAFEQEELTRPRQALEQAGAHTYIVSPEQTQVRGWDHTDWGSMFDVDVPLDQASADNFDSLLLPGGVKNPDTLRKNPQALQFVKSFFESNKSVAAICHGAWTLINAGVVAGYTLTSYESIQVDLENAGATWINEGVVVDQNLVTSRKPQDIPVFNQQMIETFASNHKHMASQKRVTSASNTSFDTELANMPSGFDSSPVDENPQS
jgi:protease I